MNERTALLGTDVQSRRPSTQVSLSRVGVTGVEKVIRIRSNGAEQLFYAELECFVDLGPQQKGAHMSRFEEIVNEAIDEVILGQAFKAETLLQIVEAAMSSEIYELMKRSDEVEVVEKAHLRPRFVEDCVREMIRMTIERFGHLDENAFVSARQENLETIHKHNVVAERHGLLGELRREVDFGERVRHHVTKREWLEDAPSSQRILRGAIAVAPSRRRTGRSSRAAAQGLRREPDPAEQGRRATWLRGGAPPGDCVSCLTSAGHLPG